MMMNFPARKRPVPTRSQIGLRLALDSFAAATGHKPVAEVVATPKAAGQVIKLSDRQPWWLND